MLRASAASSAPLAAPRHAKQSGFDSREAERTANANATRASESRGGGWPAPPADTRRPDAVQPRISARDSVTHTKQAPSFRRGRQGRAGQVGFAERTTPPSLFFFSFFINRSEKAAGERRGGERHCGLRDRPGRRMGFVGRAPTASPVSTLQGKWPAFRARPKTAWMLVLLCAFQALFSWQFFSFVFVNNCPIIY